MARPLKDADHRRGVIIRVRLTAPEKKQLQEAAAIAGLTLSDFLRVRSLNSLPRRRKPSEERAAFVQGLAQLGKIGSNLNQIARAFNRRQSAPDYSPLPGDLTANALNGVDTLSQLLLTLLEHGH